MVPIEPSPSSRPQRLSATRRRSLGLEMKHPAEEKTCRWVLPAAFVRNHRTSPPVLQTCISSQCQGEKGCDLRDQTFDQNHSAQNGQRFNQSRNSTIAEHLSRSRIKREFSRLPYVRPTPQSGGVKPTYDGRLLLSQMASENILERD